MGEKIKKNLELRMYFFVPYNISEIQKGIQCGHAALEYARKYGNTERFKEFVDNWKTWIILNGGTTNSNKELGTGKSYGSLDQIGDTLLENNIDFTYFKEPDLNNAVTSICLIVDERVFNTDDYPNLENYISKKIYNDNKFERNTAYFKLKMKTEEEIALTYVNEYNSWLKLIGGGKNKSLRELINSSPLA